jgi:hypothetical protein
MNGENPGIIEQYVNLDTIALHIQNPELEQEENELAARAIQRARAQFVVDAIATELGKRRIGLIHSRNTLLGEVSLIDRDLSHIDEALGTSTADETTPGETERLHEGVEIAPDAPVTFGQFKKVLTPYGYSSRTLTHNWKEMLELCEQQQQGSSLVAPKELCELPEPEIDRASNGRARYERSSVDAVAFRRAVDFMDSFGPHYNNQLEGIKALLHSFSVTADYRTYMIWKDFAAHVIDPADKIMPEVYNARRQLAEHEVSSLADLRRQHDELWEQADATNNESAFMAFIKAHPAFTIQLNRHSLATPFSFEFVDAHRATLEARFRRVRGSVVAKTFGVLTRKGVFNTTDEAMQQQWGMTQSESVHSRSRYADREFVDQVNVVEPQTFFDQAFRIDNFGISSAKAVLAVAYIQAEEVFAALSGQNSDDRPHSELH